MPKKGSKGPNNIRRSESPKKSRKTSEADEDDDVSELEIKLAEKTLELKKMKKQYTASEKELKKTNNKLTEAQTELTQLQLETVSAKAQHEVLVKKMEAEYAELKVANELFQTQQEVSKDKIEELTAILNKTVKNNNSYKQKQLALNSIASTATSNKLRTSLAEKEKLISDKQKLNRELAKANQAIVEAEHNSQILKQQLTKAKLDVEEHTALMIDAQHSEKQSNSEAERRVQMAQKQKKEATRSYKQCYLLLQFFAVKKFARDYRMRAFFYDTVKTFISYAHQCSTEIHRQGTAITKKDQAILTSKFNKRQNNLKKLKAANKPILELTDYVETSFDEFKEVFHSLLNKIKTWKATSEQMYQRNIELTEKQLGDSQRTEKWFHKQEELEAHLKEKTEKLEEIQARNQKCELELLRFRNLLQNEQKRSRRINTLNIKILSQPGTSNSLGDRIAGMRLQEYIHQGYCNKKCGYRCNPDGQCQQEEPEEERTPHRLRALARPMTADNNHPRRSRSTQRFTETHGVYKEASAKFRKRKNSSGSLSNGIDKSSSNRKSLGPKPHGLGGPQGVRFPFSPVPYGNPRPRSTPPSV